MRNITFCTVVYNTKDLLEKSFSSIKKHYPDEKYLIIDGSDIQNECYWYAESLKDENVRVFHAHRNIGHGSGMHLAMELINTEYVLFFDTDIVMNAPCIDTMLKRFTIDKYGVGQVNNVALQNFLYKTKVKKLPNPHRRGMVKCLHPHFCIIDTQKYWQHAPIISNAAPFVLIWLDMFSKGKDGDAFVHFPVDSFVTHREEGTREDLLGWHEKQGHIDWQLAWNEYYNRRF